MSFSNYLEDAICNALRGGAAGTSFTAPAAVYCKLHTGDPGEAGTNNAAGNVTAGGHVRRELGWCDLAVELAELDERQQHGNLQFRFPLGRVVQWELSREWCVVGE